MTKTKNQVQQELTHVQGLIENPQTSKADRSRAVRNLGELRNLLADYDAVLGAWDAGDNPLSPIGEAASGVIPGGGQIREGAEGAVGNRLPPRPKNAPTGSKLQHSKKTGAYRWTGPDGQPLQ